MRFAKTLCGYVKDPEGKHAFDGGGLGIAVPGTVSVKPGRNCGLNWTKHSNKSPKNIGVKKAGQRVGSGKSAWRRTLEEALLSAKEEQVRAFDGRSCHA